MRIEAKKRLSREAVEWWSMKELGGRRMVGHLTSRGMQRS
jgi:hypothetical protein